MGWVQSEVAKTTRGCAYDRAGMGWSEVSLQPRTAREFTKELHILLEEANGSGPFVVVGHSMAGFPVLVYAHDYPDKVSGLVLMDAQALPKSDVTNPRPAPKPGEKPLLSLLARIGLVNLLSGPLDSIQELPEGDKQAYAALTAAYLAKVLNWIKCTDNVAFDDKYSIIL